MDRNRPKNTVGCPESVVHRGGHKRPPALLGMPCFTCFRGVRGRRLGIPPSPPYSPESHYFSAFPKAACVTPPIPAHIYDRTGKGLSRSRSVAATDKATHLLSNKRPVAPSISGRWRTGRPRSPLAGGSERPKSGLKGRPWLPPADNDAEELVGAPSLNLRPAD
jgi:hypothetical protein